jgi:hypothetical protein
MRGITPQSVMPGLDSRLAVKEKPQPKRVYLRFLFYFIVILGLDPRIQGLSKQLLVAPGLPGQARQ